MKRISSPETMRDYIRISTPSVWLALFAMLLLLGGFVIWSVFGVMEIHTDTGAVRHVAPVSFVAN